MKIAFQGYGGVEKDCAQAFSWWLKSAELGYSDGEVVTRDVAEGVRWLEKAAEQGNVSAQFMLGDAYERGERIK
jgi:TPR repeat protein